MRLGSGGAQAAFLRSPGGGGRYGLKNMASGGGGGGVGLITPSAFMIASKSFAVHPGILEFGSQFPSISSVSDTIGSGFTGGMTTSIAGSTVRFGKILDPTGNTANLCIRHAVRSDDQLSAGTPNAHRTDADPSWVGGTGVNDLTGVWHTGRYYLPPGITGRFVMSDIHGNTDGGWYVQYNNAGFLVDFQIVRQSNGAPPPVGFTDNNIGSFITAGVWYDLTWYAFLDKTGAKSITKVWINGGDGSGNPQFSSTEINSTNGNSPYYPKMACYDGDVALPAGGAWHCYMSALWFADSGSSGSATQYTQAQIRGQLNLY